MKKYGIVALTILLLAGFSDPLPAQDEPIDEVKVNAKQFFESHDYERALTAYKQLLLRFPKEPAYQYGAGVCLYKLNRDPDEAINLIRSACNAQYDPMGWHFLGQLLQLNYYFEDAIKAFSKFMLLGKSIDIKSLDIERQIEMAKNGNDFTRTGIKVNVLEVKYLNVGQLQNVSEINNSGKLVKKPLEFCSKADLRENYRPYLYLPFYTELNDYVYVAGYVKNMKDRKQIFRVKNINHETWSLPEVLNEVINSRYDEEYPFFDTRSSILYFSSKGHTSMGGYDIFRSVYDWNTKTWSKPENLGFPINTPFDDYFFIVDEFSQTASFLSNRNSGPGQVNFYRIKQDRDSTLIHLTKIEEVKRESDLRVDPSRVNPVSIPATDSVPAMIPEKVPVFSTGTDYNVVLAEALNLQLKADSLGRMARDMRVKARETTDNETKKQLVSDLIKIDKEAKRTQRDADKKFLEAERLHNIPGGTKRPTDTLAVAPIPVNITADTGEIRPGEKDNFSVLPKSPYSDSNPIPKGIESLPGLTYRIQLGVFSKARTPETFGGISPVCFDQVPNSSILKYYAGLFYSLSGVTKALEKVRAVGFPDAFVIAFHDGKMITTERAKEIEFEEYKIQ